MKSLLPLYFIMSGFMVLGQLKKAPEWVLDPPSEQFSYYGLGSAEIEKDKDFRLQARKMALREIAEKIFVSIDAQSQLKIRYDNDESLYFLDEDIKVASSNYLSGHQLIDEWTDKKNKTIYVLYELDKSLYKDKRDAYFSKLDEVIDLMVTNAEKLYNEGNDIRAINELSEAVLRLHKEKSIIVEPEYSNRLEKRKIEITFKIEEILNRWKFNVADSYVFDIKVDDPLKIEDYVINNTTGQPVHQLNVKLKSMQGDVFRYAFDKNTEHDALFITGIFPENGLAQFKLRIDPELPEEVSTYIDESVLDRLISPTITINFKPGTVKYEILSPQEESFVNYVKNITEDLGFIETEEDPDFTITLKSENKLNKRGRYGYQAFFEGSVSLTNDRGYEDFEYTIKNKSELRSTKERALEEAFVKSVSTSTRFLVDFVSHLCSK